MKKIISSILILCSVGLTAQNGGETELTVTGVFKGRIKENPSRIREYPEMVDSLAPLPAMKHSIVSKKYATSFETEAIPAAKVEGEPLKKLTRSYVKGGFGNYGMFLGDAFFGSTRSKNIAYSFRFRHFSSNLGVKNVQGFSGFSDNRLTADGKKFYKKHTLFGDASYDRDVVHFYGNEFGINDLSKDLLRQRYNHISLGTRLESHFTDSSKINHNISLRYYHLNDRYGSSENNAKANGTFSTFINTELFRVNAGVDFYNHQGEKDTLNNTLLNINPQFEGRSDKWKAMLGLNMFTSLWKDSTKFYFMPQLDFHYDVYQQIIVPYVGITGDLSHNSYRKISLQNPFVRPLENVRARNTREKLHVFAGLRGSLSSNTAYNASFHYRSSEDLVFFVNDTEELLGNKFAIIYDDGKVLTFRGELQYDVRKFLFRTSGEWSSYDLKNESRAWHTPALKLDFTAKYNLENQIQARVDVIVLGKQFARSISDVSGTKAVVSKELKGIADLNLGVEYNYTKYLSAFISLNNLASTRYYRWNNYPGHKFNVVGGLSYSF